MRAALLALAFVLPSLFAPLSASTVTSANLLANPGFEEDRDLDGDPDGWTVSGTAAIGLRSPADPYAGTFSLLATSPVARVTATSDVVPFTGPGSLRLTIWLDAQGDATVSLRARSGTGAVLAQAASTTRIPGWHLVQLTLEAPAATRQLVVVATAPGPTLSLDEASLVAVSDPGNLITNGGFEAGTLGWSAPGCTGSWSASPIAPYEGTASLQISRPSASATCDVHSSRFAIDASAYWTSFAHRSSAGTWLAMIYSTPTPGGDWSTASGTNAPPTGGAWATSRNLHCSDLTAREGWVVFSPAHPDATVASFDEVRVETASFVCNHLANAGFEDEPPLRLWPIDSCGTASAVTSPVRQGARALRVDASASATSCAVGSETYALAPGREYTASGSVDTPDGATLRLQFLDGGGAPVGEALATSGPTSGFAHLAATLMAPAGAASARLLLEAPAGGTAVWDATGLALGSAPAS